MPALPVDVHLHSSPARRSLVILSPPPSHCYSSHGWPDVTGCGGGGGIGVDVQCAAAIDRSKVIIL
jgi:hypothetical protein